jgi:imidazolonepropionase-like amidohydrolase
MYAGGMSTRDISSLVNDYYGYRMLPKAISNMTDYINARTLGMGEKLGRIKQGFLADMILVEGNPLENLKYLYPTGAMVLKDNKVISKGGVKYTIKDGMVYDAKQLLQEVKQMVTEARNK